MDDPPGEIVKLELYAVEGGRGRFRRGLDLRFGLVRGPRELHRDGDHDGKEKARKLGMRGPKIFGQIKLPGPEAGRCPDQTRD
jgi:hypothetical protein